MFVLNATSSAVPSTGIEHSDKQREVQARADQDGQLTGRDAGVETDGERSGFEENSGKDQDDDLPAHQKGGTDEDEPA